MKAMVITLLFGLLNFFVGLFYGEQSNDYLVVMGSFFTCAGVLGILVSLREKNTE